MQEILSDLIRNYQIPPDECFGWIECGTKKMYKGVEIWEIPKNTVLYKGIKMDYRPQNMKYFADPYYVPGQIHKLGTITHAYPSDDINQKTYKTFLTSEEDRLMDVVYLASDLSAAAFYAQGGTGRIISFITTAKIRLLNFSNINTLRHIYDKAPDDLKELLLIAFNIHLPEFVSYGRNSTRKDDYKLLNLIKNTFLWVDGYAFEGTTGFYRNFHEEIAVFRPSLVLKRFPLEYRPTGIQIVNNLRSKGRDFSRVNNPAEIWLKVLDGHYVEPVLIPYFGQSIEPKEYMYARNYKDRRDDFIDDPRLNIEELVRYLKTTDFYKTSSEEPNLKVLKNFIYSDQP